MGCERAGPPPRRPPPSSPPGPPAPLPPGLTAGRRHEHRPHRPGQAQRTGQQFGRLLMRGAADAPLQIAHRPRPHPRRLSQLLWVNPANESPGCSATAPASRPRPRPPARRGRDRCPKPYAGPAAPPAEPAPRTSIHPPVTASCRGRRTAHFRGRFRGSSRVVNPRTVAEAGTSPRHPPRRPSGQRDPPRGGHGPGPAQPGPRYPPPPIHPSIPSGAPPCPSSPDHRGPARMARRPTT
jgi:hypothetical protein